jgi:transketolase
VVVEDHYPEGGLGAAVMEALAGDHPPRIFHLAVRDVPGSGKTADLLAAEGIDADGIVKAARHAATTSAGGQ